MKCQGCGAIGLKKACCPLTTRCGYCAEKIVLAESTRFPFRCGKTRYCIWWCSSCGNPTGNTKTALRMYAWRWFARRVKLDAVENDGLVPCVTCPTRLAPDDRRLHAGHVLARLQNRESYFCRSAVHPQCQSCNTNLSGNPDVYIPWFLKTYGESEYNRIRTDKDTGNPVTEEFLRDMINIYEPPNAFEILGIVTNDSTTV